MIKYFVVLLLLVGISCSKYDKVLTEFEKKLNATNVVKIYSISRRDMESLIGEDYCQLTLYDRRETKLSLVSRTKKSGDHIINAVYTLWDDHNKTDKISFYYGGPTKEGGKERVVHDDIEAFLKNDKNDFEFSPWHFYISRKSAHSYSESKLDPLEGWYIFSGTLHRKERDFPDFSVEPDGLILFQIWLKTDESGWLEFYMNSKNELRSVVEGTFLLSDAEQSVREPENLEEAKKDFYGSFKRSLIHKMKILKDTELGTELYSNTNKN